MFRCALAGFATAGGPFDGAAFTAVHTPDLARAAAAAALNHEPPAGRVAEIITIAASFWGRVVVWAVAAIAGIAGFALAHLRVTDAVTGLGGRMKYSRSKQGAVRDGRIAATGKQRADHHKPVQRARRDRSDRDGRHASMDEARALG